MKRLLLSIAVAGMLFAACNDKKTEAQTDGVHVHADGEEHQNHETDAVVQEEFTVEKDSIVTQEAHGHEHENGEKHDH